MFHEDAMKTKKKNRWPLLIDPELFNIVCQKADEMKISRPAFVRSLLGMPPLKCGRPRKKRSEEKT